MLLVVLKYGNEKLQKKRAQQDDLKEKKKNNVKTSIEI